MYININRIAYILWGFGLVAVVIVSLLPPQDAPQLPNFANDKVKHFLSYAILAHLGCQAGLTWIKRYALCALTFAVSVLIEFLQPLTGRDFELLDMAANFGGIILGIALMQAYLWRIRAGNRQ